MPIPVGAMPSAPHPPLPPHLFDPAGLRALRQLLARRPLLAFDLDGTLAPIVERPADARVPAPVARRLAQLNRLCPVAVVTGRSVADARPRLGFRPRYLIGNHGAEGLGPMPGCAGLDTLRARWQDQGQALRALGVGFEDKQLSLALHYRLAPEPGAAQAAIEAWLRPLPPELHTLGGKMVLNVLQRAAPDKADAVRRLLALSGCDALLFAGDDLNDEAVFAQARPGWLTVRIGPPEPASRAMFHLEDPAALGQLLERLGQALAARP